MRRPLLALVALAALAACSDSTLTGTRAPGPNLRHRSVVVTAGTLDDNIQELIGNWPGGLSQALMSQWEAVKRLVEAGETDPKKLEDAKKKLFGLTGFILNKTPDMNEPEGDDTKNSVASRLVLFMVLYVYGGPLTDPPDFIPGADDAIGLLTPNKPLTLVTPNMWAGAHFDEGSVDEDRIIIIRQNTNQYEECDGPLLTELCQYPLFYDIESFPAGALLKTATAAICHPPEGEFRGPPDETTHGRLRLAHPVPDDPDDYVAGGVIRNTPVGEEDIEVLPLVSQTFIPACENVEYGEEAITGNLLQRGVRFASALASRIGKLLTPRSAYAIDQGGGGGFDDFGSPFNNVDYFVCGIECEIE
jgi:hypothetical protein